MLENSLVNRENLVVQTVKIDNLTRKIGIPIGNHSDEFIKLKKGMIVANATKLDIINVKQKVYFYSSDTFWEYRNYYSHRLSPA